MATKSVGDAQVQGGQRDARNFPHCRKGVAAGEGWGSRVQPGSMGSVAANVRHPPAPYELYMRRQVLATGSRRPPCRVASEGGHAVGAGGRAHRVRRAGAGGCWELGMGVGQHPNAGTCPSTRQAPTPSTHHGQRRLAQLHLIHAACTRHVAQRLRARAGGGLALGGCTRQRGPPRQRPCGCCMAQGPHWPARTRRSQPPSLVR